MHGYGKNLTLSGKVGLYRNTRLVKESTSLSELATTGDLVNSVISDHGRRISASVNFLLLSEYVDRRCLYNVTVVWAKSSKDCGIGTVKHVGRDVL